MHSVLGQIADESGCTCWAGIGRRIIDRSRSKLFEFGASAVVAC